MHRKPICAALAIISAATLTTSLAYGMTAVELPAGAPADKPVGKLEQVQAFYDAMPTGVTVTETGRIFVNFPRWGDKVPFTVGEVRDGKVVAYPDLAVNHENPKDPGDGLISVQSVVADGKGRVWLLDTAAPEFAAPRPQGAKLVAVDLATNKIVKRLVFPDNVILPSTYVNDMRFDFRKGSQGTVYVTDSSVSGPGAIIVMDIASGHAVRRLSGAKATSADPAFVPVVEGVPVLGDGPDGTRKPVHVAADGIALSADGKTLYFSPLSSRHLYSVATELLNDSAVNEQQLAAAFRTWVKRALPMVLRLMQTALCMRATTSTMPYASACRTASGRQSLTIRACCGLIPCRSVRTATCISSSTSCTVRPVSIRATTNVKNRTACCV